MADKLAMKAIIGDDNLETCVMCGDLTKVRKDADISQRRHYVEGAGQLDEKCHNLVYPDPLIKSKTKNHGAKVYGG